MTLLTFAMQHPLLTLAWFWLVAGVVFSAYENREGMR